MIVSNQIKLGLGLLLGLSLSVPALANGMDDLIKSVKSERDVRSKEDQAREKAFLAEKSKQKTLLAQAKAELLKLERESERLNKEFSKNEKKLTVLETELNLAVGNLGEMFGVVRQVAGDLRGHLQNSVVSAQLKDRLPFVSRLAESKTLPGMADLEKLWVYLMVEASESGKVVSFETDVITPDGETNKQEVVRVGSFNLVSNGKYLFYQPETNQVIEFPRQPSSFLGMAQDLQDGDEAFMGFGLDPSRGSILSMLILAPSFTERVAQGGVVGYVILALLLLGLVMIGERYIVLNKKQKNMDAQLTSDEIDLDNPVGQMRQAFKDNAEDDLETLELKLDEIIIKATPDITRGIGTVKLLSAVAPLLGLLGTVTGMIVTFQSITLFGTGDPKLMAGGISQALMTTVLGLVCAIPLLLLHNWINGRSNNLIQILEEQSAGMISEKFSKKDA